MENSKKIYIVLCLLIFILVFSLAVSARDINGNETFNNLTINSGDTWTVTSSGDITLTVNGDFVIESGGRLIYDKDGLKNSDVSLTINVSGNASIDGEIDFKGVQGQQGNAGSGTQSNGVGNPGGIGDRGTDGKDIAINVENGNLEISGTVSTKGGKGGNGGTGAEGEEGQWARYIPKYINGEWVDVQVQEATDGKDGGSGGTGGTGGTAGQISLTVRYLEIINSANMVSTGGDPGERGTGGSGGARGIDTKHDPWNGYTQDGEQGEQGGLGSPGQPNPAIINVGYASISGTITPNTTINTDTSAPGQAVASIKGIKDGYINDNTPVVTWDKVSDNGNPASGIKEYIIEVSNGNRYTVKANGSSTYERRLTNALNDERYTLTIAASDNAGNIRESNPIAFTVDTDKPDVPELSTTDIQSNMVKVHWTNSSDENGIEEYIINYTIEGTTTEKNVGASYNNLDIETEPNQSISIKVKAVDSAGNESAWSNVENITTPPNLANILSITTGGTYGSYYADVKVEAVEGEGIEYRILRKNAGADSYDVQSDWFTISGDDYTYEDTLGNISEQAHESYQYGIQIRSSFGEGPINPYTEEVVIKNNEPEIISLVSPVNESIFNKQYMNENENIDFEVQCIDDDNDNLNYKFVIQKLNQSDGNYETIDVKEYSGSNSYNYLTDSLADGNYRWEIEINDGYDTVSNTYSFVVDTVAPDKPQFTLNADNVSSSGSFNVYDNILYTNNLNLNFENIVVSSDVESVNIYDGEKLITTGDSNQDIQFNLVDNEGSKDIKITAVDDAGNESSQTVFTCIYDKQSPASVSNIEYIGSERALQINWDQSIDNGASGIDYYCLEYKRVNEEQESYTEIIVDEGNLSYIISDLNYNEAIEVRIKVVDKAGNESSWYSKEEYGYTLAEEASIRSTGFDYDKQDDGSYKHYLNLAVDPVIAQDMAISYQKISESNNPVVSTGWIADTTIENIVTIEVEPHGQYKYWPVTRNNRDEETLSEKIEFEVPNNKPGKPEVDIDNYQYINQLPGIIETDPSIDPDMVDDLTYYFTVVDSTANEIIEREESNLPESELDRHLKYSLSSDELIEGQNYRWWVEVNDGYEYVKSDEVNSLVDLSPPTITYLTEETNDYHDQLIVEVDIKDSVSGMEELEYYWSNDPDNIETINLTENEILTFEAPQGRNVLNIRARDKAANISGWVSRYFVVDNTPPEIDNLSIVAEEIGGDFYVNEEFSFKWEVKEDSAIDYYRYAVVTEEEISSPEALPEEKFNKISVNSNQNNFIQDANISLEEGIKYYILLEVVNKSGFSTGRVVSSNGVFIDNTPPYIKDFELQGVVRNNNKNYLRDLSNLNLSLGITDDGTGLSGISYSFTENINNNNWVETVEEAVSSFTPIDGQSYYLAVKAEDLLGNIEKVYSEAVIFDQTSPDINEIIAGDSLQVKTKDDVYEIGTEQKIPVRLRISDQIPLTNVSYAIGTSEGSNDISENLYPEDDGWINTGSTAYTQEFEIEENLAEGRYYITFRVENSAELVSQESSNPVQVNNNIGSVPEIEDDGLYTAEDTMLHFSWTFEDSDSQPTGFEYQILTAEEELVRNWQLITNISLYDYYAEDLSLENGQEYFIKMRAVYSDSDYSGVGHSNGIKVDTTKPAGLLIDDGDYSNGERLILKWDAEDLESGISKYEIKIGKDPDGSEVTDGWIELDNSGEILLRGLELEHNQIYYTTLRVTNGVDQVSLRGSDGFKVDKTEAPEPVVIDKGKYTNEMFLKFDWELSDRDPESGIKEYHYALLNSKRIPDENEWVNAGLDKEITIDQGLIDGKEYYLAVKAINGAGMESIGYSDGILIDTTAPTPPEVVHESRYQNFQDRIRATFTVEDRESGIDYNEYYIGTIENKEAIRITDNIDEQIEITPVETGQISDGEVTLSGLDLELGEIYFLTVKAINKAGLVSTEGSSLGVKIVESDLEILNLDDYGEYSHFNNMITVDWDCEYTYIPVDYYQVAVSNSSYASNLEWFNVTRNSILITPDMVPADLRDGDKFIDGETYYVHVKAVDTSGYESDIESTDGIKLDSTPPSKPEIIYSDTHTTDKYTLKWSSTEGDSSISTYRYAIGTVRGESDISDGWRYIETDKEIYQEVLNLELLHKETYYLTVQAKNIAGLWSDITYDNGRIADLTPPEKPEVVYQGNREYAGHYITSKDKIEDIFYDSGDPETGITAYRYQLIDTKDDLNWTGIDENQVNEEEFEFTIGDLSLQENQRYYIAVQCRNRLGVWSETGFSEQLIVDTIEPDVSLANQDIELVTNDGRIDVPWDVSETATIYYRLIRPDGSRVPEIGYDTRSADAESEYIYEFNEDSKLEGIYVLEIYAVDEAGNRGDTVSQQIRINAKPVIDLGNNRTQYKGRALELSASVNDSDGEIKEYIWDFGDGSEQSNEVEPSHVYTELNRYKIILSCIDNDGGESSASIFIDITNTLEGQLAMDEIWDGPMNIIDTVIVPEGITLTIESGEVIFPENTSLLVLGTLQVNGMSENQVIFRAETDLWDGIKASGTASKVNIEHSLIKSAERGITLDSINGSVEGNLIGVLLDDNKVGIHLVNVSPVIKECRITNNSLFGIKEDGECEPTLVDNVFLNNQIGDYYDSILTILSPEELEVINND